MAAPNYFGNATFAGQPWYDVKYYGAKGDGSTDDSASIQAAVTALDAAGGGVLYFPRSSGSYRANGIKLPASPVMLFLENATILANGSTSLFYNFSPSTPQGSVFVLAGSGTIDGNSVCNVGLDFQYHQSGLGLVQLGGSFVFQNFLQQAIRTLNTAPKVLQQSGTYYFNQNAGAVGTNPNQAINLQGITGRVSVQGPIYITGAGNASQSYGATTVSSNTGSVSMSNWFGTNNHSAFVFGSNGKTTLNNLQNDSFDSGADGIDIINQSIAELVLCGANGAKSNGFAIGNVLGSQTTKDVTLIGCWSYAAGGAGFALGQAQGTEQNITAIGCTSKNSGTGSPGVAADAAGFEILANSVRVMGCRAYDDQGVPTQTYGIAEKGITGANNLYEGNDVRGNKNAALLLVSNTLAVVKNNIGYNPAGYAASQPAVPASNLSYANTLGSDAMVAIATGAGVTVSAITIGGHATGLTMAASSSTSVRVPVGQTISLTYAGGTPTWVWFLD